MSTVLAVVSALADFCFSIFAMFIGLYEKDSEDSLRKVYNEDLRERRDVDKAQQQAVNRLSGTDQVLMWLSDGQLTQARAAKRRYWKNMDASVYARLYITQRWSDCQIDAIMASEKMPGYFKKKVRTEIKALRQVV